MGNNHILKKAVKFMKVFKIAKRMLNTDTSIDYIAEMTGLYKEKIISLK